MTFTPRIQINEIDLIDIARHRNGVSGAPFDVAIFDYEASKKLAVLFDEPYHCAILDLDTITRGDLTSRWRGDAFESPLRHLIKIRG